MLSWDIYIYSFDGTRPGKIEWDNSGNILWMFQLTRLCNIDSLCVFCGGDLAHENHEDATDAT